MNLDTIENFANNAIGRLLGQGYFNTLRIFARELKKAHLDVTVEQCRVLFALFIQDERTQQEISVFLMQEKSSTSRLVNSLEKKGYVQRQTDRHDERQKRVALTTKGHSIQPLCLECAKQAQTLIREQFSEEEWKNLLMFMRKLAEITRTL